MLQVGDPYVIFEPSSALSDIFYDDVNKKIVTVRGKGTVEVKAYDLNSTEITSFRLKEKSTIRIIKFSQDGRLLCVQYDESTVDYINLSSRFNDVLSTHFSQSTKNRSAHIVGLEWIQTNQILYITNQGLELYQVNVERKSVKLLKSHNILLYWFLYYPISQLLFAASGVAASLLNPFAIQNGSIHRLAKFELDFGHSITKTQLLEREVSIICMYNALYVAVLRNSPRASSNSDVALYKISSDGMMTPHLAHLLCLDMTGAFALHVIDNLVIVHHQSSETSLLFDIGLEETTKGMCISHQPLLKTSLSYSDSVQSNFIQKFPLYSASWVMFQPNIITDANGGVFTAISFNAVKCLECIEDKYLCLRFLFNRNIGKSIFLEHLKLFMVTDKLKLKELSNIFNLIAQAIAKRSLPTLKHQDNSVKYTLVAEAYEEINIEQGDIVGNLFLLSDDLNLEQKKRYLQCMLRYLSSLLENKIEVQPYFLNEILMPTMVTTGQLRKLHQLLLYRVIPDAKQLAFQLLSNEAKYPPFVQLALDMLSRMGTATEEIVEILISRGLVIEAIRFLESSNSMDKINSLKLIESAWKENRQIRYAVFSYFLERGSKMRNSISNPEQFEGFAEKFKSLFDDKETEAAKRDFCFTDFYVDEVNQH